MELLVVLLIIGILSTVALRTIDATRDRGLFDQTTAEMNKLVHAMVGNPDLTYDGRRVDFGYYGDMEKLPDSLRELVQNTTGSPYWHGPYFKLAYGSDDTSYLFDGWGDKYRYPIGTPAFEIQSSGGGKYSMTVKPADDLDQLSSNTIAGTITDRDGLPPGDQALTTFYVYLTYNNPDAHLGKDTAMVVPLASGYYEFSAPRQVPIGIHKLVARRSSTDSLVRYVTVVPRSKTIVDFRFTSSFWNKLHVVGPPMVDELGKNGFMLRVVNDQTDTAYLNWLEFYDTPDDAWMRDFRIGTDHAGYPVPDGMPGTGPGDTVNFTSTVAIAPNSSQIVEVYFGSFFKREVINPPPPSAADTFYVSGQTFDFRFSDGSDITVTVP